MDMLKKYFPYSFTAKKDLGALIINILVYVIIGAIATAVIGILKGVFIIGLLVGIVCTIIDIYVVAGVIISILDYLKILK